MQIEITAPQNPADNYSIYKTGENRPIRNQRANVIGLYQFTEDDIENLLESQYKRFQEGKYQFNVTANRLQLITGERSARNKAELNLYPQ